MTTRAPLLGIVAVLSFFAGLTGVRLAYSLAYALVLLLVIAWIWSRLVARRLDVHRDAPSGERMAGEEFAETFTVRNRSILPLPYCEIHDGTGLPGYAPGRACALNPGGSVSWTARGVFNRRGVVRFGPLEALVGDPFGLFPRRVSVGAPGEVVVYPAIHSVESVLAPLWLGAGAGDARRGRAVDVPPETSTVREYDAADGLSRIHWPSTARAGRLMSRVYDSRLSSDVLVLLDLRRGVHAGEPPESSLEYAVSLAASICHAGIARGQAVGLVTNDREHTAIGAGRGETQRLRLLRYLATAADHGRTPLAELIGLHADRWRGRGGLIVITADRDPGWVEKLVEAGNRGQRHLCVFVDPTSFGAPGTSLRVSAAWRLALDWWIVRRGDVLSDSPARRVAGS